MNGRDHQICEKILSEIAVIEDLLKGVSPESFVEDERTARAVCMTLINIGELVKNLILFSIRNGAGFSVDFSFWLS